MKKKNKRKELKVTKSKCKYYDIGNCSKYKRRCFDCKEYKRNKTYIDKLKYNSNYI